MKCSLCERYCDIKEDGIGGCGMYTCTLGRIQERFPGRYLAAVDTAIESMPLVHYHPRGKFLQVCTVGCNFKCKGCVSQILTDHYGAMAGTFQELAPGQIIEKALNEKCLGVMFCFNEPTVSYYTFLELARMAKARNLLVGCATNGYMTPTALEKLIPWLDFVNIGLKGVSHSVYRTCGVPSATPVYRNLEQLYKAGVYLEVSAIFRKHGEQEILAAAGRIAALSTRIPFQVMRFIPFGEADPDMEPSVRESETVCDRLRQQLDYVYLFNTPGTAYLHSFCPDCGRKILERGFFGPMCANLFRYAPEGRCQCGFQLPILGKIHNAPLRERGYFGGYRTINALNMIRAIAGLLGIRDKSTVDRLVHQVIETDFIKTMFERMNDITSYLETVDYFADLTHRQKTATAFRQYVEEHVGRIREKAARLDKQPVYCALGHPLIAMFDDKMESRLIETVGGELTTRKIQREDRPGITISKDQFCRMTPEIIIVSGQAAWPKKDFLNYCATHYLTAPALEADKVFYLDPYRATGTRPDWILGLMRLANLIHPETFHFDLQCEADRFYQKFFNAPFTPGQQPESYLKEKKFQ